MTLNNMEMLEKANESRSVFEGQSTQTLNIHSKLTANKRKVLHFILQLLLQSYSWLPGVNVQLFTVFLHLIINSKFLQMMTSSLNALMRVVPM